MKLLRLVLLALIAAPGLSQSEDEPYFALSTQRTFAANSKPSVSLNAWNVESLEFRVYRINDPVQFFQQLESPHEFGGRTPRPPHERTLLERIHEWKHSLRTGIRLGLRGQFTESPSAHMESILPHAAAPANQAAPGPGGTQYAVAPLLNSQQLVLSFNHSVKSRNRWESQPVDLAVKDRGVYLVEAVRGELRAYTLLMVSDMVLVTKTGNGRIVNFLADRGSGEPVRGAQVFLLARDARKATVETDSNGFAEIPQADPKADDLRLVARSGANYAVTTLSAYAFETSRLQWMGYIYTDRPVYRPGHTVHFKGILRQRTAAGYTVPAGKQLEVEVQDAEQKPVFRKTLTATANGTVRDEFTLAPSSALGSYSINVRSGEENYMNGSFDVEEYKKPEYEVRVTATKPRILQGEPAQAVIDSRYYFGEPVAGAKVKYAVYRAPYWFPLWYEPDENAAPDTSDGGDNDYGDEQILDEEGTLDGDGRLNIQFDTTVSDRKTDYRYRIEARVTDQGKREIVGRGGVIATYGSFVVNAQPDRYFYQPGSHAAVTVQARDYDFKPVRTRVHVELYRWTWRNRQSTGTLINASDVDTGGDGNAAADVAIPAHGGSYRVRVTARTPEGRDVDRETYLWVAGGSESDFGDGNRKTVQIIPDKKTYRAGETAKLLIVTGAANTPVLVSIEGRDLRSMKLMRSGESTVTLEVPVTSKDEPGIWVNAQFIRKGAMYQGAKLVKVPPEDHKLNINLATEKAQYRPGETAQYSVQVTAADGKPMPGAEFSLGVVDEAIYAIRRDMTQDPLAYFFGNEWNMVHTEDSLNYYFSGEAGKRRMRLAALREPSHLAQLKPDRMVQPKIRKAFPDTAFWNPDLVTDAAGKAVAKVEFPDSLTTWRATARAVTADTRVGAATLKTIVRKNLILRLSTPRFFVQGDEIMISALVHNYLTTEKSVRVSLDLKGLDVVEGSTRDVRVLPRADARLDWRVRVQQVRSATITGKALTDEESDALELELPVNVPGVKVSRAKGGSLSAGGAAAFDLAFPAKAQPGSRVLAIRLAPSIAGSLFGALDYLTTFPYGCVEQTMSSFLPNIVVTQAVNDLGLKVSLDKADVQQKIRAGLDRLYNYQHEDGGWGWWETDESHAFMSAYVVAGLAQAKAAGIAIDAGRLENGANWVVKTLTADPKLAADLRGYMVYALGLAGKPQTAAMLDVYNRRDKLSPYGVAVLGLALEEAKDPRAAELAAALEQAVKVDDEQAWWPSTRDQLLDFSEDSTPEATAFAVKFLSHQRPNSPLLPKAALWLMNNRGEGYWWNSTKQTAMVIYGLTDYLKSTNELNPNVTATVLVNDQPVLTRKFDQSATLGIPEFTLDESKLQPGVNRIRITTTGQGKLYYSARAEAYSAEDKLQKTGTTSLNILRDYFRLVPVKQAGKIVYALAPLNGPVASGDTLAVRITVTGTEWKYLMVEDPIPSGTEFIERDTSYELKERPPWWQYLFTRRELHDDRMAIFQTWFPQGQQQFFYLLKVVNPGAFQVSPARVQPMYNSGVMATTEALRLEAK
uniref:Alpha-2-macroglobulin domain protein n=1 Tax=Solibacter usitatus (strain Ellin6076) TaxID=234267 RepID=Q025N0_SOLUE